MIWMLTDLAMMAAILGALCGVRGFSRFALCVGVVAASAARIVGLSLAVVVVLISSSANAQTFATLDPADKHTNVILSGGDLSAAWSGGSPGAVRGTIAQTLGKHYFEVTVGGSIGGYETIGVANAALPLNDQINTANGWGLKFNGQLRYNGAAGSCGGGFTSGQRVMVAWDATAGNIWYGVNGTWQCSGNPATGASPAQTGVTGSLYPVLIGGNPGTQTANFGASTFVYTPPSGFNAGWCNPCEAEADPDGVDMSGLFAMQAWSVAVYVLLGGTCALVFIGGIRMGRRS